MGFQHQWAKREQHVADFFHGSARQRFNLCQFTVCIGGIFCQHPAGNCQAHGDPGNRLYRTVMQFTRQPFAGFILNFHQAFLFLCQVLVQPGILNGNHCLVTDHFQ